MKTFLKHRWHGFNGVYNLTWIIRQNASHFRSFGGWRNLKKDAYILGASWHSYIIRFSWVNLKLSVVLSSRAHFKPIYSFMQATEYKDLKLVREC